LLLVREVWGSNPEQIKSPTRCQRLATLATLIVWALAQSRKDGHRSLVTPERVLSEYKGGFIQNATTNSICGVDLSKTN